jgi:N-acetylglutamate synthase-like GNAT family acetyltransferase
MTTLTISPQTAKPHLEFTVASADDVFRLESMLRSGDESIVLPGLHSDDPLAWRLARSSAGDSIEDFVVARVGSAIVGGGGLEVCDESAVLRSLALHMASAGADIVRAIVERLIGQARSRGCNEVYVLAAGQRWLWQDLGFGERSLPSWPATARRSWQYQLVACFEEEYLARGIVPMCRPLAA